MPAVKKRKQTLFTKLANPNHRRRQAFLFFAIFAIGGAAAIVMSRAATTVILTTEAESTQLNPAVAVLDDSAASGGKTLQFNTNTSVSYSVTLPSTADSISIRTRGDQCKGGPQFKVTVDNVLVGTGTASTSYSDTTFSSTIAGGARAVVVSYTNDTSSRKCNRNLYLDKLTFYSTTVDAPAPVPGTVLWQADMEERGTFGPRPSDSGQTGNTTLPDFYAPETGAISSYGGGEYNSGGGTSDYTSEQVHSGSGAAKLVLPQYSGSNMGVRLFRWNELRQNRTVRTSAWYYIPVNYTLTNDPAIGKYWILQQFKSSSQDRTKNDPFWYVNARNRADGSLAATLAWGYQSRLEGPHATESGWKNYGDVTVPVGRWFKLDMQVTQSKDFDGTVSAWLDGQLISTQNNVRTGWPSCTYNAWCVDQGWSVTHYSDGLNPAPSVLYIDDAVISKP
jgi:hypothetical protein